MLVDTDVLIWFLKKHQLAIKALAELDDWRISLVTYIELIQGCRNKAELILVNKELAKLNIGIIPVNETIGVRAAHLVERYALSHKVFLADAFIASTAVEVNETLLTGNHKHFSVIPELQVQRFTP